MKNQITSIIEILGTVNYSSPMQIKEAIEMALSEAEQLKVRLETFDTQIERFIIYPTNTGIENQVVLAETVIGDFNLLSVFLEAKKSRDLRNGFSFFYKISKDNGSTLFDYNLKDDEFKVANEFFKIK